MSFTHTKGDIYEFKNTGIILMQTPTRFLSKWALIFTTGRKEIMTFDDIHYMKYSDNGITVVTTTFDSIKVYTINFDDHELNHCTIDLYEWIREKICPSPELPSAT